MPRLGRVSHEPSPAGRSTATKCVDDRRQPIWIDEPDKVQGIVLLRKGEASLPALHDVEEKIESSTTSQSHLLPGVQIEPYYDRTELIGVTTETVRENLIAGHGAGDGDPADVPQQRPQRR